MNIRKELDKMRAYLDVGACMIEESQTEDVDWVNNWKQYVHQFYIDDIPVSYTHLDVYKRQDK